MAVEPDELYALRKAAGMNQGEVAEAIGMSMDSISRMERSVPGYPIERRTELAVRCVIERRRLDQAGH